jgi:flavin reductase (DIM6/NTAB) family NADH-FMN oxidoreductase RutF
MSISRRHYPWAAPVPEGLEDAHVPAARFRTAMGHFATGVAVVGATDENETPYGSTANAITSVSVDPPLVLICMQRRSVTLGVLLKAGFFSLSVLDAGQTDIAQRFAHSSSASGWMGLDFDRGASGAPMLDCALATIEASVHDVADGGDHQIVIGRTLTVDHPEEHVAPLLFYRGTFAGLSGADRHE